MFRCASFVAVCSVLPAPLRFPLPVHDHGIGRSPGPGINPPDDVPLPKTSSDAGVWIADNLFLGSVQDALTPLFADGEILIATGYQDLLSAMAIISELVDTERLRRPGSIRLLFGTNVTKAARLRTRRRELPEEAKAHFLRKGGIYLEDWADLVAVRSLEALRAGTIAIRMFDGDGVTGRNDQRLFHAKVYVGRDGSLLGSANFSRSGLTRNVELADFARRGTPRDDARRSAAERFWEHGADWSNEAIAILETLLKGVTPEHAVARVAAELRGFPLWQPAERGRLAEKHALLPFQKELVYETTATVYEHGFAFVEAPPGAGKTVIGQHLAVTLADTHAATFAHRPAPRCDAVRTSPMIVAPPAVEAAWTDRIPLQVFFVRTTQFSSRKRDQAVDDIDGLVGEAAALVVDEAHNFATRWRQESARARRFETVPALWTACLSATLVGNHGTDTILTMQERRAAPNMTDEFRQRMDRLMQVEWNRETAADSWDIHPNVEALAEELARFVCRRSRSCVGPKPPDATYPTSSLGYPAFAHEPIEINLTDDECEMISEVDTALDYLEQPGRRRGWREEARTRLGTPMEQRVDLVRRAARELRMLLRVCNTAALWEADRGQIAKYLQDSPQGRFFYADTAALDQPEKTVRQRLADLAAGRLDDERVRQLRRIAERHRAVVFISERRTVLQYFASKLAVLLGESGFRTFLAVGQVDRKFQERYLGGKSNDVQEFTGTNASARLQAEFDATAVADGPEPPRKLAFTTYKRAEGINLQVASAVVLIGVGADVRMLRQALGRIDRVDSPHPHITYYTLSLDGLPVPSDEAWKRRLREGRQFTHGAAHTAADPDDGTDMVAALLEQNDLPRTPRLTNLYDCLWVLEREVPENVRSMVGAHSLQGPWGIELTELQGDTPYTVFCLRGVEAQDRDGGFGPPRLVLVRDDTTMILDQVEILRALTAAYQATNARGLVQVPTRWTENPELLERVQDSLGRITPWCLRPARTVALLETLAAFMSDGAEPAESLFSGLSLPALEMLYQEWLDVLDPAWREAKRELREVQYTSDVPLPGLLDDGAAAGGGGDQHAQAGAAGVVAGFPGYIHCQRILDQLLRGDAAEISKARARMAVAIKAAEEISEGAEVELWSRIGVVIRVSTD